MKKADETKGLGDEFARKARKVSRSGVSPVEVALERLILTFGPALIEGWLARAKPEPEPERVNSYTHKDAYPSTPVYRDVQATPIVEIRMVACGCSGRRYVSRAWQYCPRCGGNVEPVQ